MEQLARLRALEALNVAQNRGITDAGVPALLGMRRMACLNLSHTRVTGASAPLLAAMPALRSLALYGCKVNGNALEGLCRARPDVVVNDRAVVRAAAEMVRAGGRA